MPDENINFQPLPWPPSELCTCGNFAAWEMSLPEGKVPLCSECYQIETLKRTRNRGSLLCDRIHRHWLIYPAENPLKIRSDGAT